MCFSHYVSGTLSYIFSSASLNLMCLVAQLCLTLCDPMDCSPPDSSVHGDSPGIL